MKTVLLLGNFTFHHLTEEELALFTKDTEHKALIHEVREIKEFDTIEEAYVEADNTHHESWIIPKEFSGEIATEDNSEELKKILKLTNH